MRILGHWLGQARETAELAERERAHTLDCYRYLLRTAPHRAIERAHTEAFDELSPLRRLELVEALRHALQEDERAYDVAMKPRLLARLATRAELREPGTLERALGVGRAAPRVGEGRLFALVASAFVATAIAQQFLGGIDYDGRVTVVFEDALDEVDYEEAAYDTAPLESFLDRNGVGDINTLD